MPFDHKGNYIPGNHADRNDRVQAQNDAIQQEDDDFETMMSDDPKDEALRVAQDNEVKQKGSGYDDDPNSRYDNSELLPSQQNRSDYRY